MPSLHSPALQTARNNTVSDAKVYTVGGDTVDTRAFIATLDKCIPGCADLITITGGDLPIASKLGE